MRKNLFFGNGERPLPHWVIVPRYSACGFAERKSLWKELKSKGLSVEFKTEDDAKKALEKTGYGEDKIEICEAEWL